MECILPSFSFLFSSLLSSPLLSSSFLIFSLSSPLSHLPSPFSPLSCLLSLLLPFETHTNHSHFHFVYHLIHSLFKRKFSRKTQLFTECSQGSRLCSNIIIPKPLDALYVFTCLPQLHSVKDTV